MDVEKLISDAGIRISPVRVLVARAIANAERPVSSLELEQILGTVDRSSITRTLAIFSERGLVHSVDDGSGSVRYELCLHCGQEDDPDTHPHFHCLSCGETFCLHQRPIPEVLLPEGFVKLGVNFVVKGLCPRCAHKH